MNYYAIYLIVLTTIKSFGRIKYHFSFGKYILQLELLKLKRSFADYLDHRWLEPTHAYCFGAVENATEMDTK